MKSKSYIRIFTIFILVGLFFSTTSISSINHHSQNDAVDIPTWNTGDNWISHIDFSFKDENYSLFGNIKDYTTEVKEKTTITVEGESYDVYKNKIFGDFESQMSFPGMGIPFSFPFTGQFSGYSYIRISDLAQVKNEFSLSGVLKAGTQFPFYFWDIEVSETIGLALEGSVIFSPPLENYDFPINVGETWDLSSTLYFDGTFFAAGGAFSDSISANFSNNGTMICSEKSVMNTPAGIFESYNISAAEVGGNVFSYFPEIGSLGAFSTEYSDENMTLSISSEIIAYDLNEMPITIVETINPNKEYPGNEIEISGSVSYAHNDDPIAQSDVTISIPAVDERWTIQTNELGKYSLQIDAPTIFDYTLTEDEIGSDGIIVSCFKDGLEGYTVKTFTTIRDEAPPSFSFIHPVNGLYYNNQKILPFFMPCTIGPITIDLSLDEEFQKEIQFDIYVNDEFLMSINEEPFSFQWDESSFGSHTIKVIATDIFENSFENEIKIFNIS